MTIPEIPEEARLPLGGLSDELIADAAAAWKKAWYAPVTHSPEECLRAAFEAALPHLRVQETPAGAVERAIAALHRERHHFVACEETTSCVAWREGARDVEALRAEGAILSEADLSDLPTEEGEGETTHLIADGEAVTRCCGRTPFELPHTDRITMDPSLARGCDDWVATATRLGFELGKAEGRKEALTEAVTEIEAASAGMYYGDPHVLHEAVEVIRNLMPQPSDATSKPLAASTGHSDLPQDAASEETP